MQSPDDRLDGGTGQCWPQTFVAPRGRHSSQASVSQCVECQSDHRLEAGQSPCTQPTRPPHVTRPSSPPHPPPPTPESGPPLGSKSNMSAMMIPSILRSLSEMTRERDQHDDSLPSPPHAVPALTHRFPAPSRECPPSMQQQTPARQSYDLSCSGGNTSGHLHAASRSL